MTKFHTFLSGACLFALLVSCEKKEEGTQEQSLMNEYVHAVMQTYYLWNGNVPGTLPSSDVNPREYFNSLLHADDSWSYITDEREKLLEEKINHTGETFGYSLSFGRIGSSGGVFAVINYVYPGSPAALAGLTRGDLILQVNDADLTEENYLKLYETGTLRLLPGKLVNGAISKATASISLTSAKMNQNPVLLREVTTRGANKIGYLMYTNFVDNFSQQLIDALSAFKNEGITDLVLDLRYNPGGGVQVTRLLCSALVPPTYMKKENILIRHLWNATMQANLDAAARVNPEAMQPYLSTRFEEVAYNLNLPGQRLYVLTSRSSASASELVIAGLEPYMEVVQVGDSTGGKYTAMIEFTPEKKSLAHWMLLPVVYKFANKDGKTDFKDGLAPDVLLKETLPLGALGTASDPLFAKAIELITGEEAPAAEPAAEGATWLSLPTGSALDGQLIHRLPTSR
jgi:C-terminal processing protease CtpA/Prc